LTPFLVVLIGFEPTVALVDRLEESAWVVDVDPAVAADDDGLEFFVPHDATDAGAAGRPCRVNHDGGTADPVFPPETYGICGVFI